MNEESRKRLAEHAEELKAAVELKRGWQKGLNCPQCGANADRPKCVFELGGDCPRHDVDNYDEEVLAAAGVWEPATSSVQLGLDIEVLLAMTKGLEFVGNAYIAHGSGELHLFKGSDVHLPHVFPIYKVTKS